MTNKTTEELNRIIEKLCGIPTDRKHWDSTIKAQIFYELRDSIQDLIKLQKRLEYINYDIKDFYDLAQKEGTEIIWRFAKIEGKPSSEIISFEEFKKYYQECADCYCEFDGEFLKLRLFWTEEDLLRSHPYIFGIITDV